ncbi:cell division protein ZipA [Marinobacterium jannaschii]|uniref:cell division protein ZipA n=1 Tax=Marinobacterium jannaschii TaxID=64970 RepID=UPI0004829D27|nr:cell division protein ZipA [Marinobacterium jannaschii]
MEIGLREWLVIGGIILIALIVLDGWRRMRSNKAQLRMKIDRQLVAEYSEEQDDSYNPELPNGGARVIGDHPEFADERHHIEPTFDTDIHLESEVSYPRAERQYNTSESAERDIQSPADHSVHYPGSDSNHAEPVTEADSYRGAPEHLDASLLSEDSQSPTETAPSVQFSSEQPREAARQWDDSDPLFSDPGAMPLLQPEPSLNPAFESDQSDTDPTAMAGFTASALESQELAPEPATPGTEDKTDRNNDEFSGTAGIVDMAGEPDTADDKKSAEFGPALTTADEEFDFNRPISQLMDASETDTTSCQDFEQHSLLAEDVEASVPNPPLEEQMPPLITDVLAGTEDVSTDSPAEPGVPERADDSFEELPGGDQLSAARPARHSVPSEKSPSSADPGSSIPGTSVEPEAEERSADSVASPAGKRRALSETPDPENVLVITVVAGKDRPIGGAVLHKLVEACGMQHGDMDIYHRFEDGKGQGAIQFSMANAVSPGSFELSRLDSLQTPAVSFFMSMEEPDDVMNAYECMLATAETVAKHMKAELLDENRSVMRPQTKQHYRQRIRDFEMHKRSRRPG